MPSSSTDAGDSGLQGGGGGGGGRPMDKLWKSMFEDTPEGKAMLQPNGQYYAAAARSLGVPSSGPLDPRMLYQIPDQLLRLTAAEGGRGGSEEEHMMNFRYVTPAILLSQCYLRKCLTMIDHVL